MSLHTIVGDALADRLHHRSARVEVAQPPAADLAVRLHGMSMRLLETALALIAIAAAVLLSLAR